jgi:hypothetical protein
MKMTHWQKKFKILGPKILFLNSTVNWSSEMKNQITQLPMGAVNSSKHAH